MQAKNSLKDVVNQKNALSINGRLTNMLEEGGVNAQNFWGMRRKILKSNLEDLQVVKTEEGIFSNGNIRSFEKGLF